MRQEVLKFLKANNTAVIATTHQDEPAAAVVYYVVDNKYHFYFLTKRGTDKYLNCCRRGSKLEKLRSSC